MEETISLKEIFEVIRKRLLLIISLIVGAALISAVISFFVLTPTYESSAQFIVNQSPSDPSVQYNVNDIRTNVELINTYNVIITSRAILEEVVEELDLPISSDQLGSKIQVSSAENSQVVTVTVTDSDPDLATQMANATVKIFQKKVPDYMNVDNVRILSEAETKADPAPISPKPMLNIAIAVVIGAMVGVGLAFLLEYLDTTIKSEADIEKRLDVPVLGVVSHVADEDINKEHLQTPTGRRGRSGFHHAQKKSI